MEELVNLPNKAEKKALGQVYLSSIADIGVSHSGIIVLN